MCDDAAASGFRSLDEASTYLLAPRAERDPCDIEDNFC